MPPADPTRAPALVGLRGGRSAPEPQGLGLDVGPAPPPPFLPSCGVGGGDAQAMLGSESGPQ